MKEAMFYEPLTPVKILRRAREIGYEAGLQYVYEGSVPGEGGESTYCHRCKGLLDAPLRYAAAWQPHPRWTVPGL